MSSRKERLAIRSNSPIPESGNSRTLKENTEKGEAKRLFEIRARREMKVAPKCWEEWEKYYPLRCNSFNLSVETW